MCNLRSTENHTHTEDFFTELWAFVLQNHPVLTDQILQFMNIDSADHSWKIETQVAYSSASLPGSDKGCRPDLRIENDSIQVLVEHKIDSKQSRETVYDDNGNAHSYSQVERYLALTPTAKVAFISLGSEKIDPEVLHHPQYLKPEHHNHFRWLDFYPIIERYSRTEHADLFVAELVQFMFDLSMHPPRKGTGMLPSTNEPNMLAERKACSVWWVPTIDLLERNGWRCYKQGLEAEFCRRDDDYPNLYFDMRYGEQQGIKDGVLKVRLRMKGTVDVPMGTILYDYTKLGYESRKERYKSKKVGVCTDIVCSIKQTRPEYIGDEDPSKRLADFALSVLKPIHAFLGLPDVIEP